MTEKEKELYEKTFKPAYDALIAEYSFDTADLPGEIWLDVQGFEGVYKVSNKRRLKSYQNGKEKILKPILNPHGYLTVALYGGERPGPHFLHVLVAQAFLENPDNKPEVDHIDGDRMNCFPENLRYVTRSENIQAIHDTGRGNPCRGEKNPRAHLTNLQAYGVIVLNSTKKFTTNQLAEMFSTTDRTIRRVVKGERYPDCQPPEQIILPIEEKFIDSPVFKLQQYDELKNIRTLEDNGKPLFCFNDICNALGVNVKFADRHRKPETSFKRKTQDSLGRWQNIWFVNEVGFFDILMRSRKDVAEKIRAHFIELITKYVVIGTMPPQKDTASESAEENEVAEKSPAVLTVENVRGYLDAEGTAWLNVEDVARGLGFVKIEEKFSTTSGRNETYETIRWARVNQYLAEFGFSKEVGKEDFIPENIFYRLAMKAKNEVAEKFQAKVADEVLPSIRKTGKEDTASESAEETSLQIFNNAEFGEIRTTGTWDNPLFCLADVCRALKIGNPSQVKTRLEDRVISNEVISDSLGRKQNVTFVNEDGLYDVILDSRKPEAKKFRKWITSEVLPSIRKTGKYELNPASEKLPLDKKIDLLKFLVEQSPNAEIKIKYLERIAELI